MPASYELQSILRNRTPPALDHRTKLIDRIWTGVPSIRGGRAIEIFLLAFAPIAICALLNFKTLMQSGTIDPYVYTGYIGNFEDLIQRYTLTYYAVRFGLILPSRVFEAALGPEVGYLALRYCLSLLFGVSLYSVAKRYLSRPTAIFIYIAALASPYVARFIFWDHPDATGVPFLTAGICMRLIQPRRWRWGAFGAGCLFGMAINSNFFTIALIGLFEFIYAAVFFRFSKGLTRLALQFALVLSGIVAITASGAAYYSFATGYVDIIKPTWQVVQWLSSTGMNNWRLPGAKWTLTNFHVWIPAWLALCCLVCVNKWIVCAETTVMCCYGIGVAAFYYVHQFLLQGDILQLPYYFSYAAPAILLMLAVVAQIIYARLAGRRDIAMWFAAAVILFPWLAFSTLGSIPHFSGPATGLASVRDFGVIACSAVFLTLLAAQWRLSANIYVGFAALAVLCLAYDAGFSTYTSAIVKRSAVGSQDPRQVEWNMYRVAHQLMSVVPKQASQPGGILFWYDNVPDNPISSIQATYLWGYSRLNAFPPQDKGLPALSPAQVTNLNDSKWRYLALLCLSPAELQTGLAALRAHDISFREDDRRTLASGNFRLYYELVDFDHAR